MSATLTSSPSEAARHGLDGYVRSLGRHAIAVTTLRRRYLQRFTQGLADRYGRTDFYLFDEAYQPPAIHNIAYSFSGNPVEFHGGAVIDGRSIKFNGSKWCVLRPMLRSGYRRVSVAAWFKCTSTESHDVVWFSGGSPFSGSTSFFLTVQSRFEPVIGLVSGNYWTPSRAIASWQAMPLNVWTHAVVSLDLDTKILTLYINGQLVSMAPVIGPDSAVFVDSLNYLGRTHRPSSDIPFLKGEINSFAVINAALSQSQAAALMQDTQSFLPA